MTRSYAAIAPSSSPPPASPCATPWLPASVALSACVCVCVCVCVSPSHPVSRLQPSRGRILTDSYVNLSIEGCVSINASISYCSGGTPTLTHPPPLHTAPLSLSLSPSLPPPSLPLYLSVCLFLSVPSWIIHQNSMGTAPSPISPSEETQLQRGRANGAGRVGGSGSNAGQMSSNRP